MKVRWLLVGESKASKKPGSPRVGDLVCVDGQSTSKAEFAKYGGCSATICDVDEKLRVASVEYLVFAVGMRFCGLKLSQFLPLDPFDEDEFVRREKASKEAKRQKDKAAREARKEKKRANEN